MIISDIKLRVGQEHKIFAETVKRCGYEPPYFRILKKSLDARNKSDVKYVFSVEVSKEPFASKKTVVIDAKKNSDSSDCRCRQRSCRTFLRNQALRIRI